MSQTDPADWIGRTETRIEFVALEPVRRMEALLDRTAQTSIRDLPPLGHWLFFLPDAPQSDLGPDGHPSRGGFYPPLPLPMRMWAGSRIDFLAPVPIGSQASRIARIKDIQQKSGRTGPLAFVTVESEIRVRHQTCVREELDVVFRDRTGPAGPAPPGEVRAPEISRTIDPTTSLLFRYSALTYNAHRIHYDRDYATGVEGYPGLVVHGPLLATLLMDHFRRDQPDAMIRRFSFRAQRPVYDLAPFTVNLRRAPGGATLWAADADGYVAMDAQIEAGA